MTSSLEKLRDIMLWNERRSTSADMEFTTIAQRSHAAADVFSSVDTFQSPSPSIDFATLLNFVSNNRNNDQMSRSNSTRSRSTSGDNGSTTGGGGSSKGDRYKTEMCRAFSENGSCRYGDKCQFAHGLGDRRNVSRHPKYKTDLCRTFHSTGFCPYGTRCHFIHAMNEGKNDAASVETPPATTTTTSSFVHRNSLLGLALPAARHLSTALKNSDTFTAVTSPSLVEPQRPRQLAYKPLVAEQSPNDLNVNILAHLLRTLEIGHQQQQQQHAGGLSPKVLRSSSFHASHPLSPTHSLDSTAYSSDHSLSPCPSPSEDLFSAAFSYPSQQQNFPRSPNSVFSSLSESDDSIPVWPSSIIPGLSTPFQSTPSPMQSTLCQNPFASFAQSASVHTSNKHYIFA